MEKKQNLLKIYVGTKSFKFVILTAVLVFSIFMPSVIAQTPTFLIDDVYPYNASGYNNVTVRVCSNRDTIAVNSFSFNTTLFNSVANTSITNATITQCGGNLHRASYNSSNVTGNLSLISVASCAANQQLRPLQQAPFPQCADFVLNVSWADSGAVVNVTAFNESWNPGSLNASVVTINQYLVKTQKAAPAAALGNIVLMGFNETTNSFANFSRGPALTDSSGYWMQHCNGLVAANGSCIGQGFGYPDNRCIWHGISFFSGQQGGSTACLNLSSNANVALLAYDFISSNGTKGRLTLNQTNTLTLDTSTVLSFVDVFKVNLASPFGGGFGPEGFVNLSAIKVYGPNGVVFTQALGGIETFVPPAFLNVSTIYTLELTLSTGARNYSFVSSSNGLYGAMIQIEDTSGILNPSFTTIKGQIVNSSNASQGLSGAVVFAKFHDYFSPPMGIVFVNSTTTDTNGIFSLRVPSTSFISEPFGGGVRPFPAYDLFIVSNATSASTGAPLFFPTVDKNDDRGYFAQGTTAILKPIKLSAGGLVNVNVTLNNATGLLSELSRFSSSKVTGEERDAFTSRMTMLKLFEGITLPATVTVPLVAPTGNLVLTVLGQNQSFGFSDTPPIGICFNTTTINQGQVSSVNCNLASQGNLNLNVTNCQNIITNPASCTQQESLGNFHFWFENTLVIANSTGYSQTYIESSSFILENILRGGTSYQNLSIPLPAGDYQLKIVPRQEFSRFASLKNTTAFTITAGQTTPLNLNRTERFQIEPRFFSLTLSANNNINVSVRDPVGSTLNSSHVAVTAQLLYPNKSAVGTSPVLNLAYDANANPQIFYNTTANFSAAGYGGVTAGKYLLIINATNATGSSTYTTTFLWPISLSDFGVGINLGGFTFGTGQMINGKVYAFDTTTIPPTTITGWLRVELQDQTGAIINSTNVTSGVNSGEGSFSLLAPSNVGFYSLTATVNASGGKSGTAENWLQVSNLALKVSTDRFSYQPTDKVTVTVEVRNASSSSGIANANVELSVDGNKNSVSGATDSNGKASVILEPSKVTSGASWTFGFHSIKVKVSKDTPMQVINLETFYGFEVRGIEAFVEPEKPSYSTTEAVKINVFVPPSTSLTSNPTAVLDGLSNVTYTATQLAPGFYQFTFNAGSVSVGRHSVQVTVTTSSGSQTLFTGFEVISTNILVETRSGANLQFNFNSNELANLTVTVINATTGSPIENQEVIATLYKVSSPNDINITRNASRTNAAGFIGNMTLNVSNRGGPHYVQVSVGNQIQYAGLMVSSLKVSLMNTTPGATAAIVNRYTATPGSTVDIFVNATSGGSNVGDGSIVTLRLWAFGRPVEITNTTTNGNATLSFTIPTFAPKLTYGLDVSVTASDGSTGFASPAELVVTGSSALKLEVEPNRHSYTSGSGGTITAVLTYENGTSAPGYNITFERGLPGSTPTVIGTAVTGSTGAATVSASSMGTSDGEYFVHALITNETTVSSYSGYSVSSLNVSLTTNKTSYNVGEGIGFNVTVRNATIGTEINASGGTGFIMIFDRDRGAITVPLTVGNSQPYTASLSIPNDSSAVGTYGVGVEFTYNGSKGFDFTLINVRNNSATVSLKLPSSITAGTAFNANISASAGSKAGLVVFSPAATSVVYENTSISITPDTAQNITLTISDTGTFVVMLRVEGVGDNSTVVTVSSVSAGAVPAVWAGSSLTANSTSFSNGGTVFIISNTANATARVLRVVGNDTVTTSLPLTQTSGSNYFTTFTPSTTGNHYVRLDKSTASAVSNTMFVVT